MLSYGDDQEHCLKKVVLSAPERNKKRYISEEGVFSEDNRFGPLKYAEKGFDDPKSFSLIKSNPIPREDLNIKVIEEIKKELSDSFVIGKKFEITDKDGEKYRAEYHRNNDPSIIFPAIVDEINVYKDEKKVAYLLAKYYTEDGLKQAEYDGKPISRDIVERFLNKATIDYIRVEDDYKGKGIGTLLYLNMAQMLNENKIEFRSSTLISGSAKAVWEKIDKLVGKKNIRKENWDDGVVYFLKPPKNQNYYDYNNLENQFKKKSSNKKNKKNNL